MRVLIKLFLNKFGHYENMSATSKLQRDKIFGKNKQFYFSSTKNCSIFKPFVQCMQFEYD